MTAPPPPVRPSLAVTILLGLAMALLWGGLWMQVLILAPTVKKRYDEFGLLLPGLSRTIFRAAQEATTYWWLSLPLVISGVVVGASVWGFVRHRRGWDRLATAVAALLLLLLLVANVTVAAGLVLPEIKLQQNLRR